MTILAIAEAADEDRTCHGVFRSSHLKPSILLLGVVMLGLAGCGGGSGNGPTASMDATGPLSPVPPAQVANSPNDDDEFIDICDTYVCDQETQQPSAEAGTAVGAPIIYSTTGGPLPDTERAGRVQVGANVTPLPDWKRPNRWSDPVNGVSVSTGGTYDGARVPRVTEYVLLHINDKWEPQGYANEPTSDTPGLASFPHQPVLRVARGTSDEHTAYVLHAAALINSTLPRDKRILIGSDAPPLVSVDTIPDGEIFVDFAAKSDWIFSSEASAANSPAYSRDWDPTSQRWEIKAMRASHVWVDPSAFHTQVEFVRVLTHELLHALGLRGHAFVDQFPESLLRNTLSTILPTDSHVPAIDADGLLAIYTRLPPGTEPETLSSASLAPWENEALRMHGELNTLVGAAFGVAFRNGLARPWAHGPEPLADIPENPNLSGSVTWDGALLGFTPVGQPVAGSAKIAIDLASLTGRADFIDLQENSSSKWQDAGIWSMWGDGNLGYTLAVRGNVFRETGGDHGILTGIFVGRQHEGAVGTLERVDLSAAFGASIYRDHSDTPVGATEIVPNAPFSGRIDSPTDIDYFRLPIASAGILTITTSGGADPNVSVFDAAGVEIPGSSGSWIVNITKSVLEKGKHVVVKLSGGNPGSSYSAEPQFESLAGVQEMARDIATNLTQRLGVVEKLVDRAIALCGARNFDGVCGPTTKATEALHPVARLIAKLRDFFKDDAPRGFGDLHGQIDGFLDTAEEEAQRAINAAKTPIPNPDSAPSEQVKVIFDNANAYSWSDFLIIRRVPLVEGLPPVIVQNSGVGLSKPTRDSSFEINGGESAVNGISTFEGWNSTDDFHYRYLGAWGRYNFHQAQLMQGRTQIIGGTTVRTDAAHAFSTGYATGTNPTLGSASWVGVVSTVDSRDLGDRTESGQARITVNFTEMVANARFSTKSFPLIQFSNMAISGGRFASHSGQRPDRLSGTFYGPNHEEAGGTFSYYPDGTETVYPGSAPHAWRAVVGAFSAKRSE